MVTAGKIASAGLSADAKAEFTNNIDIGKVIVTKTFSGIDKLPDGFQITNNYNKEVFTVANAK